MADKSSFKPVPGPASYDYPVIWNAFVDAVAEMTDPFGVPDGIRNIRLLPSIVGGNTLKMDIKTRDGSAPSADSPVPAAMRNATLATGDFNPRKITAALAIVISSGSTLGKTNDDSSYIYYYLIDNAGALELAVSSMYFGESGIVSTTAEGGAGGADSAAVMYSATARAAVPFRCAGRIKAPQAAAGTWTALPTVIELGSGPGILSGTMAAQNNGIIQCVYAEYLSNAALTTQFPQDDTIPQNTEGTEILTAAITPKYATSRIRVRWQGWGSTAGGGSGFVAALFVDTTANALCAADETIDIANYVRGLNIEYEVASASTSARTYKIRVGPVTATTLRLNGNSASRFLGGICRSTLTIEEIL